MNANGNIQKNRLIVKKDQLGKIQIPMGHKYKKRIFTYWTSGQQTI